MVETRKCAWVLFLWCLAICAVMDHVGAAPVGAPSPSMDCSSALVNLVDCLSFVQEGSKLGKPEGKCCSGLKKVVKEDVSCLCVAFSSNFGVTLNMTKALSLPSVCRVSTPPFSKCKMAVAGVPGAAPAPSLAAGNARGVPAPSPGLSSDAGVLISSIPLLVSVGVAAWSYYYF